MKRLAALSKRVGEGGRGVKRWGCWPRGPRRGKTPDSHTQDQRLLKREYDTQIHRALKTVEERRNPFKHHKNPPVILRLQEGRGMPSRETRGEFPALCGGEDWEEVQAELDRERRNPTANTPSAPGAAPVRRRPPHPRRRLALEGKGKAGHTLHLPLPGTATAARREPGGRWKVPSPCRGWLQHRSCAGRGPVYLWCRCTSDWRHAPLRGRPRSSCSASRRRVAPCWRQPCRSSSFRCVCSLPDAPSGCGTHRRALPLYPSRVPVSQTSPRRRDDSVAGAGRCPL